MAEDTGLPFVIDATGERRYLGNLAPTRALDPAWPVFGAYPTQPLIPRDRWRDLIGGNTGPDDAAALLDFVHDQDGIGMCNCSATAAVIESCRALAGLPHVPLSGGDLYRRICGGYDRGSLLEDGIRAAHDGILPVSQCPYLDWQTNRGTDAERKPYSLLEVYVCPTFDAVMSAVLQGWRVVSGIMWYSNYTPGRDGWLPRGSGGGGGHAIMGYKPTWREVNGQTEFGIWHKNSWTKRWGMDGLYVSPEASYRGPVGGWWAARVVRDEGGDVPAPRN